MWEQKGASLWEARRVSTCAAASAAETDWELSLAREFGGRCMVPSIFSEKLLYLQDLLKTNEIAKSFWRKLEIEVQVMDLEVVGISIWVESMGTEEYTEGKDKDQKAWRGASYFKVRTAGEEPGKDDCEIAPNPCLGSHQLPYPSLYCTLHLPTRSTLFSVANTKVESCDLSAQKS